MYTRRPAVSGQFYPGTKNALRRMIESMLPPEREKRKAKGVISPHAGYMYSGRVAACVYSAVEIPGTAVIMGPSHTGFGKPYAIIAEGVWETPLGGVSIDKELARGIMSFGGPVEEDISAHIMEHSIEVQVPFLKYFNPSVKIVPIVIRGGDYGAVGSALASAVGGFGRDVLVIASSDMTHYEPQKEAEEKDRKAIDAVLALDEEEMLGRIEKYDISMCGCGPSAIMLISAKLLGAKRAELIKYMTSGDTTGDYASVVGYAGLAVF